MSNGRVINSHNRDRFNIRAYQFGTSGDFESEADEFDEEEFIPLTQSIGHKIASEAEAKMVVKLAEFEEQSEATQQHAESVKDEPAVVSDSKTIELLYKKIEELTDKIVKYEMELEDKDAQKESALLEAKESSYEQGYQACTNELNENFNKELEEKQKILLSSVQKLDNCVVDFEKKMDDIQKELVSTALAIGSEVIKIELSSKSSEVAERLARELLSKLKDAATVTIKVNSEDLEYLKIAFGESQKIILESDDAILKGGVIVLSQMGNLDGTIASRLEKVIKEAT